MKANLSPLATGLARLPKVAAEAKRPARPKPSLTVSVVICCYTEARWVEICSALESCRRQTRPPDEIIVVVDHCPALRTRVTEVFGSKLERPGSCTPLRVTDNGEAQGLSNARNEGVGIARGDVVAFLDDDAAADERWLEELLEPYADDTTAGVGGRVVPRWSFRRPAWFPPEFDWVIGCSHSGMPETRAKVRNFVGANMSFRRTDLEAAGAFSTSLGRVADNAAGCEETELCLRAASRGVLVYEPRALVQHDVPPSRATWRYFLRRCFEEGTSKAIVAELAGSSSALSDERRYVVSTVPRALLRCIAHLDQPEARLRAAALVSGVLVTSWAYMLVRLAGPDRRPGGRLGW